MMQRFNRIKTIVSNLIRNNVFIRIALFVTCIVLSMNFSLSIHDIRINEIAINFSHAEAQSWWDALFKKIRRSGGSGSPFCVLWPKAEDRSLNQTVSEKPLFIWKNSKSTFNGKVTPRLTAKEVRVFEIDENTQRVLIWKTAVNPDQQQIRYGEGTNLPTKNLEIGKIYKFEVAYVDLGESESDIPIQEMPTISAITFERVKSPEKNRLDFKTEFDYLSYLMKESLYGEVYQSAFDLPNEIAKKIRENSACSSHPKLE